MWTKTKQQLVYADCSNHNYWVGLENKQQQWCFWWG